MTRPTAANHPTLVSPMRYVSSGNLLLWIICGFFAVASAGCRPTSDEKSPSGANRLRFKEIGQSRGVDFVHDVGKGPKYFMPHSIGSGAALLDYDNDGRLDIYLIQNAGSGSSSRNKLFGQQSDGAFEDVSSGSGVDIAGYGMGAAAGDINNDGMVDLLVTEFGGLHLFLNQAGKFADVTNSSGISSPLWGTSAAMVDYDRDGLLDLVVVNYVDYDPARPCGTAAGRADFCAPREFEGTVTKLFHNLGPSQDQPVRFEDVTLNSGIGLVPGPGLGVLPADFNGDHWPDLLIANDGQPNRLWINLHDGTFRDEALERGVAHNARGVSEANMGVAWGDVDGNGLADLFITHLTEETHTLWRQESPGLFQDRTVSARIPSGVRGTGFGTALFDCDCDGDLDLAIANGRVSRRPQAAVSAAAGFWEDYAEPNQLLLNDGRGGFADVSTECSALSEPPAVARGLAVGDLDNDGRLDLVITHIADRPRILHNVVNDAGHWLLVRAVDPNLKRDAYGAEITVHAGGRRWSRLVQPAQSYLCSSDPRAHFGLGDHQEISSIEVVWPNGSLEQFSATGVDRLIELKRGEGQPERSPSAP